MFRLIVLLAAIATVKGQTTNVVSCTRSQAPLPLHVYIEGCVAPPCQWPQLQHAVLHIQFEATQNITSMRTEATAFLGILAVPYDLGDNSHTCNFLENTHCPLVEGQIVSYTLKMFIEAFFPVGTNANIEIRVVEEATSSPIFCLRTAISVVPPTPVTTTTTTTATPPTTTTTPPTTTSTSLTPTTTSSTTSTPTTTVSSCTRSQAPLPLHVYIEGCVAPPCQWPQLQHAVLHIQFEATQNITSMRTEATVFLGILPVPYDLGDNSHTCNFLENTHCPLVEGQIVSYTLKMYIEEFFPVGTNANIEIRVVEEVTSSPIFCLRTAFSIVQPVNKHGRRQLAVHLTNIDD